MGKLNHKDWPECEEFYDLMQAYRHAPVSDHGRTIHCYWAVKEWIRKNARLTEGEVRGAVESAIEITAIGDGRDERQSIDYKFLTKALNDLIEQEASDE